MMYRYDISICFLRVLWYNLLNLMYDVDIKKMVVVSFLCKEIVKYRKILFKILIFYLLCVWCLFWLI